MYESPYTAWLIHQDKVREAVILAERQELLKGTVVPAAMTSREGLLSHIRGWLNSRHHPTRVAADVRSVPAH